MQKIGDIGDLLFSKDCHTIKQPSVHYTCILEAPHCWELEWGACGLRITMLSCGSRITTLSFGSRITTLSFKFAIFWDICDSLYSKDCRTATLLRVGMRGLWAADNNTKVVPNFWQSCNWYQILLNGSVVTRVVNGQTFLPKAKNLACIRHWLIHTSVPGRAVNGINLL